MNHELQNFPTCNLTWAWLSIPSKLLIFLIQMPCAGTNMANVCLKVRNIFNNTWNFLQPNIPALKWIMQPWVVTKPLSQQVDDLRTQSSFLHVNWLIAEPIVDSSLCSLRKGRIYPSCPVEKWKFGTARFRILYNNIRRNTAKQK
jgi:hypothetical protein